MKMRKSSVEDGTANGTPALMFESEEDRDRAAKMCEAMEWLSVERRIAQLSNDEIYLRMDIIIQPGASRDALVNAILAAKEASER